MRNTFCPFNIPSLEKFVYFFRFKSKIVYSIVLLLYLLFGSAEKSKLIAQSFIPMPDSNAYWLLTDFMVVETFSVDSFKNDTSISANKYTELFYTFGTGNPVYYGAYRNDTINKKVFFVPKDSTQEYLLYDFSLNIGDTASIIHRIPWPPLPFTFEIVKVVADSIKNKTIGPRNHKRIHLFGSKGYEMWTEGIGGRNGIINSSPTNANVLLCMSYNDTIYYSNNFSQTQETNYFFGRCDTLTVPLSVHENLSAEEIQLFPSITSSILFIKALNLNSFPLQVKVYNSLGVLCKEYSLEQNKPLNISDLPSSIYFFQIQTKQKQFFNHKIIKQ